MKLLPKMAFRNLARYKKRTFITAGAIAYGIMMFVVVQSMLKGVDDESIANLKFYETADGRIMQMGYWEKRERLPLDKSFKPEVLAPILESVNASWAPRIVFGGDLIFYKDPFPEDGSIPGQFTAIDMTRDAEVFRLKDTLEYGYWPAPDEPGLVLGHWLAEDIGADIGSPVLVATRTRDGQVQVFDLTITGIINCPNPEITRSGMFLPIAIADNYLEMDAHVTEVNVNFAMDNTAENEFKSLLKPLSALGLEALDWKVLGADFITVSRTENTFDGLLLVILLIIAAVGISNTMLMAVYERTRELGIMRAMGMRDRQIRALFLWESGGIGLLGSILGLVLGVLINWPIVHRGIDYSALMRDNSFGYRVQGQLYGVWDPLAIIGAFFLGIALAVLVTSFSTHRILRMDISSSLRS